MYARPGDLTAQCNCSKLQILHLYMPGKPALLCGYKVTPSSLSIYCWSSRAWTALGCLSCRGSAQCNGVVAVGAAADSVKGVDSNVWAPLAPDGRL